MVRRGDDRVYTIFQCLQHELNERHSPLVGGTLAHPYDHFPAFHGAFWKKYPYFLPCAVSATFSALAFIVGLIFLKEVSVSRGHLCRQSNIFARRYLRHNTLKISDDVENSNRI